MGIRSITNSVTLPFSSRETITSDVVRMVLEHNQETRSNDHLYLEAIPLEYRVGSMVTNEPWACKATTSALTSSTSLAIAR